MKTILSILFASTIWFSGVSQILEIKVKGNTFIDSDGTTMVFRGLNTSDPDKLFEEGHWNDEYFDEIKNWGANVVRFPVHPRAWRERGSKEYLKLLDHGILMAKKRGIHVIIDWHSIGNLRTELFQSAGYETSMKETTEFWTIIAERYKYETAVLGFELFNEPTTAGDKYGTCSWNQWKSMMEEVIGVIRGAGNNKIVLVAGFNWAYDLSSVIENPIGDSQVAYVSHPYPQKRAKPWEEHWEKDWGHVADIYPVILTEIGFCAEGDIGAHVPVITDDTYGPTITSYAENKGISFVAWVFDPRWAPRMFKDWDFTPSRQGMFFKKYLQQQK